MIKLIHEAFARNSLPRYAAIGTLMIFAAAAAVPAQELKAVDVIKKHLEAIGKAEVRSKMGNYFAVGTSSFASKLPEKKTAGKALIVSEGSNLFVLTSFASQEYPFEKIGFFGDKPSLPYVTSGTRSPLGAFIAEHPALLSEGLFTGSMSTTWPFREGSKFENRIGGGGTRKIDGRKVFAIDYFPSTGSSEFTIKLFFDAETFNHVRTEYRHVINPKEDNFGTLGRQAGLKQVVTETFSDFKTVDGMTMPHTYKIDYLTDSNSGVYEYHWGVTVANYYFNQKLEPGFFTFDPKP